MATRAGAAEHMLLAALVELYSDAAENDVRLGLLRVALQALQRHGEPLPALPTPGTAAPVRATNCHERMS